LFVCFLQWVQSQLDGHFDIPAHEKAPALKWKRNDKRKQNLHVVADEVMDVRALDPEPTTFSLTMLGSGQEVWIPHGKGKPQLETALECSL
jgi:hypothetical protein